jgi:hypothetical protein
VITCVCGSTGFRAANVDIDVVVHVQDGHVSLDLVGITPGQLTVDCVDCGDSTAATSVTQDQLNVGEETPAPTGVAAARQLMLDALIEADEIVDLSD